VDHGRHIAEPQHDPAMAEEGTALIGVLYAAS